HATKISSFQDCEDAIPGLGLGESADDAVLFRLSIGIGLALDARLLRMRFVDGLAADGAAGDLLGLSGRDISKNVVVDRNGGGKVAPAKTRNVADLYIFGPGTGETAFEVGTQLGGTVQMAAHISADSNFCLGRGGEMKMWIEAGDRVYLVERSLRAQREFLEFRFRQKPVAKLDGSKVVKDHGVGLTRRRR